MRLNDIDNPSYITFEPKNFIFLPETVQLYRTVFKRPLGVLKFLRNKWRHSPSPEIISTGNIPENFVKTIETLEDKNTLPQIQRDRKLGAFDEPMKRKRINSWFANISNRKITADINNFKASTSITVICSEEHSVIPVPMSMSRSMSY